MNGDLNIRQIQWRSEIRTCPDFKWSKKGWVANGLVFECHLKSGHFSPVFEWSGFRMDHLWSDTQLSGFRMSLTIRKPEKSGFQIMTMNTNIAVSENIDELLPFLSLFLFFSYLKKQETRTVLNTKIKLKYFHNKISVWPDHQILSAKCTFYGRSKCRNIPLIEI